MDWLVVAFYGALGASVIATTVMGVWIVFRRD